MTQREVGSDRADTRSRFRVFLSCSHELVEEREVFDSVIRGLAARPEIARSVQPEPVRWDRDASGPGVDSANRQIERSVDFSTLDVVVVVIWRKVGQWTKEEYDRAIALFHRFGKPQVLVYMRTHPASEEADDVVKFRDHVFNERTVASPYADAAEFAEKLARDVVPKAPPTPPRERARGLRVRVWRWGAANFLGGVAVTMLCALVSFPSTYVNTFTTLTILFAPFVLLLTTLGAVINYRRLLTTFVAVWRSPSYTDEQVWTHFDDLVPALVMPLRVARLAGERSRAGSATVLLTLALLVAAGPVGAVNAVFNEVLVWEYAVGWAVAQGANGPILDERGLVRAAYVDANRRRWPLSLQDHAARSFHDTSADELIYVHAHGKFCDADKIDATPIDQRFRCNLGPEVKLPFYAWLMVASLAIAAAAAASVGLSLARLRRRLSLLNGE